jgi:hypothetical protein
MCDVCAGLVPRQRHQDGAGEQEPALSCRQGRDWGRRVGPRSGDRSSSLG